MRNVLEKLQFTNRVAEKMIRDNNVQLEGAKETNSWARILRLEAYGSGLSQMQILFELTLKEIEEELESILDLAKKARAIE